MTRVGATLIVFLALAAWAGAQGPAPALTAADRVKLFKLNRDLVKDLVGHGVSLAKADDPLRRAEECRQTAHTLRVAVQWAADAEDANRVAELGDHLQAIVRDGMLPNLKEAQRDAAPGSPAEDSLRSLRADIVGELDQLVNNLPTTGKVAESDQVRDLRQKLGNLRDSVK